jgi:hypothetical protein
LRAAISPGAVTVPSEDCGGLDSRGNAGAIRETMSGSATRTPRPSEVLSTSAVTSVVSAAVTRVATAAIRMTRGIRSDVMQRPAAGCDDARLCRRDA